MRLQKSVYYMTDSELRAYKRRKRRQRIIRNRILTLLITISMIAFLTIFYHSINSSANTGADELKFKYYTQITVSKGETLWSIADSYIDYTMYKNKASYVSEVKSINCLNDCDDIKSGQVLVVPYYSTEFY